MPRQAAWKQQLGDIFRELEQIRPPDILLDGAAVGKIFRVSHRQATRILGQLGATEVGGCLVIGVSQLMERLRRIQSGEQIQFEQNRRARLRQILEQARREARSRRIVIPAPENPPPDLTIQGLPADIKLEPGKLTVAFSDPPELLGKLLLLARTMAEDWSQVEHTVTAQNVEKQT